MKSNFIFFIVIISAMSCRNLHQNMKGEQLNFPMELSFTSYADSCVDVSFLFDANYKIVIALDSFECTGCKLQLDKWKQFMVETTLITQNEVAYLFYIQPTNVGDLKFLLRCEEFNYPVCIDSCGVFMKLNQITSDEVYLLNKENRVVLNENPINDSDVKKMYLDVISRKNTD